MGASRAGDFRGDDNPAAVMMDFTQIRTKLAPRRILWIELYAPDWRRGKAVLGFARMIKFFLFGVENDKTDALQSHAEER